jgi:hypothetical protein
MPTGNAGVAAGGVAGGVAGAAAVPDPNSGASKRTPGDREFPGDWGAAGDCEAAGAFGAASGGWGVDSITESGTPNRIPGEP